MHFVVNEIFLADQNDETSQVMEQELFLTELDQKN